MSYKSILVTGADGFIGSHLVEELVNQGFNVKAFVHYNFQNNWGWIDEIHNSVKKEIEIIQGDVRDYETIKQALKNCEFVFNLAALIGIPYSYKAPRSYIDTNLNGLLNIMNIIKEKKNARLVHVSTSEVYGSAKTVPMNENHPLNAQSPYAASKIAADAMANSFYNSFGLQITIVRPFNTFGPRQSLRAIIPTIITQLLDKKTDNIKLGNINVTRDFTYVSDTINAFISSINVKKAIGQTINIGSSFEISIREIVNIISRITNIKKKIIINKERTRISGSEVERLYCSNVKAKKLLNWKQEYKGRKGFIKAIEKTIEWYQNPLNLKKFKLNIYNI